MSVKDLRDRVDALTKPQKTRRFKPHIRVKKWFNWVYPYLTVDEAEEYNNLTQMLYDPEKFPDGNNRWGSCEAYKIQIRIRQLEETAEDRAILEPVDRWPACLRDQLEEYKTAIAYERAHPSEIYVHPCQEPRENTVYVDYYYGFRPRELTVPVGTTVTWQSRDDALIVGHFLTHPPKLGPALKENRETWKWEEFEISRNDRRDDGHVYGKDYRFTFTEPGIYSYKCSHEKYPCGEGGCVIVEKLNSEIFLQS